MKADTRARTQGFTFAARLHREKEAQARLLIVSQDRQNAKAQRREERRVKEEKKILSASLRAGISFECCKQAAVPGVPGGEKSVTLKSGSQETKKGKVYTREHAASHANVVLNAEVVFRYNLAKRRFLDVCTNDYIA